MPLNRFALDWNLDMSNKWKVVRIGGDGGGVAAGDTVELAGSRTGVNVNVIGRALPWGTGSLKEISDNVQGSTNFTGTTRTINVRRTTCLFCTAADSTTWVARPDPNKDVYERNWKLTKDWQLAMSDPALGLPQDVAVTFEGGTPKIVKIDGKEWANNCFYDVSLDQITGKRKDNLFITIIRRSCLICQLDSSGGNSWVAVEGGMP